MTKNISFGYIRLLSLFGLTIECDLYRLYYFVNTLLELKRSVEYIMAEVMICRGGFGSGSGSAGGKKTLKVEYIYETTDWVVPEAINNEFDVRIFGGGGGAHGGSEGYGGGGGGWMNNSILSLNNGDMIQIQIGNGGSGSFNADYGGTGSSGGTSSFGIYLSANGGSGGTDGRGGNGGSGGFGYYNGGIGYQFGGGGQQDQDGHAGNGGVWGGGGGCVYNGNAGHGGIYGGVGSGRYGSPNSTYGGALSNTTTTGINTIGWSNVPEELQGTGTPSFLIIYTYSSDKISYAGTAHNNQGNSWFHLPGGGFGGCSSSSIIFASSTNTSYIKNLSFGAGGYGSNAGGYIDILSEIGITYNDIPNFHNVALNNLNSVPNGSNLYNFIVNSNISGYKNYCYDMKTGDSIFWYYHRQGGGGYGGDGGISGGGGYGKSACGANGGGGYYAPAYGEGGASFGNSGNSNDISTIDGIHGGGGSVYNDGYSATSGAAAGNGGNGICIIRYYVKE